MAELASIATPAGPNTGLWPGLTIYRFTARPGRRRRDSVAVPRGACPRFQQVEAYIGYMAPSSYITNAAAFATADFLRRVTTVAYRTRELQIARPDSGIGSAERSLWEGHDGWQPARKAVEYALVSYDFGEAFTALNLVLGPTLDDVLLTQLGRAARTTAMT